MREKWKVFLLVCLAYKESNCQVEKHSDSPGSNTARPNVLSNFIEPTIYISTSSWNCDIYLPTPLETAVQRRPWSPTCFHPVNILALTSTSAPAEMASLRSVRSPTSQNLPTIWISGWTNWKLLHNGDAVVVLCWEAGHDILWHHAVRLVLRMNTQTVGFKTISVGFKTISDELRWQADARQVDQRDSRWQAASVSVRRPRKEPPGHFQLS